LRRGIIIHIQRFEKFGNGRLRAGKHELSVATSMPSSSADAPPATLRVTSGGKIRSYIKYSLDILPVSAARDSS
jgi:hypothetical protein